MLTAKELRIEHVVFHNLASDTYTGGSDDDDDDDCFTWLLRKHVNACK